MRLISTIVDATARVPKRVESNQSLEPGPAALIESNLAEGDLHAGPGPNTRREARTGLRRHANSMRGSAARRGEDGAFPTLIEE